MHQRARQLKVTQPANVQDRDRSIDRRLRIGRIKRSRLSRMIVNLHFYAESFLNIGN